MRQGDGSLVARWRRKRDAKKITIEIIAQAVSEFTKYVYHKWVEEYSIFANTGISGLDE